MPVLLDDIALLVLVDPPVPGWAKLGSVRSSWELAEHPVIQPAAPNAASPEAAINQRTFRISVSRIKEAKKNP
jgi:hypothetical protein